MLRITDLRKRRGKFRINHVFIQDDPQLVMKIMGMVIIYRAESLYEDDVIEYHALSPHFNPVVNGCVAPMYEVIVTKNSAGIQEITFK